MANVKYETIKKIKSVVGLSLAFLFVSTSSVSCAVADQSKSKKSENAPLGLAQLGPERPIEIVIPAKEIRADSGYEDFASEPEMRIPLILFAGATGNAFAKNLKQLNYYQRVEYKNLVIIVNGTGVAFDAGRQVEQEYKTSGDVKLELRLVQLSEVIEEDINFKELNVSLNIKDTIISYLLEISCKDESKDCGLSEDTALQVIPLLYRAN